ncbi:hypothetical protein E2562_007259 [Oryza meyeriana var. granulata]|uniref:Uncharacterized protein n=1 Tax=Oryza meyeriana var. granulata TaxID=110450 RepID=A0A6G1CFN2_9ORYZ|nr:hypothetical protein E2562_007259 [Oryza meyeriana var. granulata]
MDAVSDRKLPPELRGRANAVSIDGNNKLALRPEGCLFNTFPQESQQRRFHSSEHYIMAMIPQLPEA